jgi:ABC-type uncharacterized transport system involved in gliding motility auxiliary subunit
MKTISSIRHSRWKILFWLGPIFVVMGLSAGIVSGSWGVIPLGLMIVGMAVISLWLLVVEIGSKGFWGRRSTQVGTNALLAILGFLVVLSLINFLALRSSARLDVTEKQFLSLAPQSQQVLETLPQPVKVTVFESQPEPRMQMLLEEYQRRGGDRFRFEFVDPQAQPGLAQRYGLKAPGEIFLESGQRIEPLEDRFSEANLTAAIQRLSSDRRSKIYFTQGHGELPLTGGEGSLSKVVAGLKADNMLAEPLNLLQQQIPQDSSVVVVAGVKQPFLDAEVKLLETYLQRGGSLLLLVDPETKTGLESLLQTWRIALDGRLIVDASGAGQLVGLGPAVPLVTRYGQHPITNDFDEGAVSFFPLAQAVDVKPAPEVEVTPLLFTGDQSWAESNPDSADLQFNPEGDRKGPLTLGVALHRPSTEAQAGAPPSAETRLVVIGDSDFATDALFEQGLNGSLILNTVTWLGNRTDLTLKIRPKEATNRRLNLTTQANRLLNLIALGLFPSSAFAAAGLLWWRRR